MSQSRVEHAIALHQKGYNCAQAVICTYADLFGIDEQTAYKMSEGFWSWYGYDGGLRSAHRRTHARRA